jgi:hypothetical protein
MAFRNVDSQVRQSLAKFRRKSRLSKNSYQKKLASVVCPAPRASSKQGRQSRAGVLIRVAKAASSASNFRGGSLRASLAASLTTQTPRGAQRSPVISRTRRAEACRLISAKRSRRARRAARRTTRRSSYGDKLSRAAGASFPEDPRALTSYLAAENRHRP